MIDRVFRGQQEQEQFLYFFRHHWIVLLREFMYLGLFLIFAVGVVLSWDYIRESMVIHREARILFFVGYLGATVFVHRFFWNLLN